MQLLKIWAKSWLMVIQSCLSSAPVWSQFVSFCFLTAVRGLSISFRSAEWLGHGYKMLIWWSPSYLVIILCLSQTVTKLLLGLWEKIWEVFEDIFRVVNGVHLNVEMSGVDALVIVWSHSFVKASAELLVCSRCVLCVWLFSDHFPEVTLCIVAVLLLFIV